LFGDTEGASTKIKYSRGDKNTEKVEKDVASKRSLEGTFFD